MHSFASLPSMPTGTSITVVAPVAEISGRNTLMQQGNDLSRRGSREDPMGWIDCEIDSISENQTLLCAVMAHHVQDFLAYPARYALLKASGQELRELSDENLLRLNDAWRRVADQAHAN